MDRSGTSASLVYAAPLLCLLLYGRCLGAWFQLDDFAWLGLRDLIGVNQTWTTALFAPMAQGTVRPISERLFFIVFRALFDLDAFPYHALTMATQLANLILLSSVARRLAPDAPAWFWAPLLWGSHSAIAWPMAWAAAYNQILCSFFFLAGLLLLDRAGRTGRRRDEAAHWILFLLGFGVLELNAIYPVIALAFAAVRPRPFSRSYYRRLWLLPLVSILYVSWNSYYAPKPTGGPYALALDGRIVRTLGRYVHCTIWPACSEAEGGMGVSAGTALFALAVIAILAILAAHRAKGPIVFGLIWFAAALSPYLLLPDKISLYYLTVPAIGFSIAAASVIGPALECPAATCRLQASLVVAAILPLGCLHALRLSADYTAPSLHAESLVRGVQEIMSAHPGKLILLEGVDERTFWDSVYHHPFRLAGASAVLLAPGSEARLRAAPEALNGYQDYILDPASALHNLNTGEAVVYELEGDRLRNITGAFRAKLTLDPQTLALPRRVEVARPWFAHLLGPSWHDAEGGYGAVAAGYRWMPKRASVRLRGPASRGEALVVSGYCTASQLPGGPLTVTASVDAGTLGTARVASCGERQELTYRLPRAWPGAPACRCGWR
ncbi:MAG: hypothetical protein R2762_17215 [Bryobacteraceae bacterium]